MTILPKNNNLLKMNLVALSGNVTRDPEVKQTPSGKSVARFGLAISAEKKDGESMFFDVDVWDQQAEFVGTHVKKGSGVEVVGRLNKRSYEKDGVKVWTTDIVATSVRFNGSKKPEDGAAPRAPAATPQAARPTAAPARRPAPTPPPQGFEDESTPF